MARKPRANSAAPQQSAEAILIVCEGAKTETTYFRTLKEQLKLPLVEIATARGGSAVRVVEDAYNLRIKREEETGRSKELLTPPRYKEVWCVFDVEDVTRRREYNRAIEDARRYKFQVAVSNPAFEIWYMLHFRFSEAPYQNGNEVKDALKAYIPDYTESKNVFAQLTELREIANRRARRLDDNKLERDQAEQFNYPWTSVYKLVDRLYSQLPPNTKSPR